MQVIEGTTRLQLCYMDMLKLSTMAINVAELLKLLHVYALQNITGSLPLAGGKLAPEQGRRARIRGLFACCPGKHA
jgi:hypothetical protein